MECTFLVWVNPYAVWSSETVQEPGFPWQGVSSRDNSSGEAADLGFICNRLVIPENKRGCNRIICPCTQIEEYYVSTEGRTVYLQDQKTITPSLPNPLIWTTPPGTLFTDPLQVAVLKNGAMNRKIRCC